MNWRIIVSNGRVSEEEYYISGSPAATTIMIHHRLPLRLPLVKKSLHVYWQWWWLMRKQLFVDRRVWLVYPEPLTRMDMFHSEDRSLLHVCCPLHSASGDLPRVGFPACRGLFLSSLGGLPGRCSFRHLLQGLFSGCSPFGCRWLAPFSGCSLLGCRWLALFSHCAFLGSGLLPHPLPDPGLHLLAHLERAGGADSLGLDQGPVDHQPLDGLVDAGIVLLHIVASGSQSLLEGGRGHAAPLLGRGHGFYNELTELLRFHHLLPGRFRGYHLSLCV